MTSRRDALKGGGWLCLGLAVPALPAVQAAKSLLILGGTGFLGPHLTDEARARGWKVTHFNRGRTAAGGVPGVETVIGDRNGQLDNLRGRHWDVVIDDSGYVPKYVKSSAELLAPEVGHCIFVSSISVYADFSTPNDESSATGKLADPDTTEVTDTSYGPMKALCEQYCLTAFSGRCTIVRPGYIVGPLDRTDRFTYWPVRASKGGEMLAPGAPTDPVQIIDVRDLARWMIDLAAARTAGCFNAASAPREFTMGKLIEACLRASRRANTRATWVPESFLASHWKADEMDLPPWSPPTGDTAAAALISTRRAQSAGLRVRGLDATVRDTLAWFQTLPLDRQAKLHAGLDPAREAQTLSEWDRHSASTG